MFKFSSIRVVSGIETILNYSYSTYNLSFRFNKNCDLSNWLFSNLSMPFVLTLVWSYGSVLPKCYFLKGIVLMEKSAKFNQGESISKFLKFISM